jgi:hypothetical protein
MPRPVSLDAAWNTTGAVKAFFRWWLTELEELLIDTGDRFGSRWRRSLHLSLGPDTIHLRCYRRSNLEREESWPRALLEMPQDSRWKALPRRARLEVPAEWCLTSSLKLPAAARQHLESAIELKLPRLSPVPPEQVYHGYQIVGDDSNGVEVTVAMVRKRPVDDLAQALQHCGISLTLLEARQAAGTPLRLYRGTRTPLSDDLLHRINLGLAGLAVAALMALVLAWHQRMESAESALDAEYSSVKARAVQDLNLREQLEDRQRVLKSLRTHLPPSPATVLMSAFQTLLPPPIWVQKMDLQGREAHVTLYVPPRAEVAKLLLEDPRIQSVTENSRVSLGVGITEERVELFVVLTEPSA